MTQHAEPPEAPPDVLPYGLALAMPYVRSRLVESAELTEQERHGLSGKPRTGKTHHDNSRGEQ